MLLESIRLSEVKREGDLFYIDIYVENKDIVEENKIKNINEKNNIFNFD